ncbi:MAG TPA: hypothetical protein PKC45_16155 [Gemmatales bacterium]|nr:hypothetical protein [Gemmatales bacterium]
MRCLPCFWALVTSLLVTVVGWADNDLAWLDKPYDLKVVLHVEPHPLLTPQYIDRVQREVQDTLQRDLGPIGRVTVILFLGNEGHPAAALMHEVLEQGWKALDKPFYPITHEKLHFVRIVYNDGDYEIQARQVDGDTGLVSVLRRARTSDRLWVARQTSLLLAQDFGMTGQVIGTAIGQTVKFRLRAATLGTGESIQVRADEVFAIAQINRTPAGDFNGFRLPDSILLATGISTTGGECTARLFTKFDTRLKPERATVAYRLIKLGTRRAPLSLRVIDSADGRPIAGAEVQVFRGGFPTDDGITRTPVRLGATDNLGRIRSTEVFDHVCFTRLALGRRVYNLPLTLLDDQPQEVFLQGTDVAEKVVEFDYFFRRWERLVGEVRDGFELDYQQKVAEVIAQDREKAVANAEELAKKLTQDVAELRAELVKLNELAGGVGEAALVKIRQAETTLKAYDTAIARINDFVEGIRNPSPARQKANEGAMAEQALDFDRALRLYAESLRLEDNAQLRDRVSKMRTAWNIKNDEHRAARDFVIKDWKPSQWAALEKMLDDAEKQFTILQRSGDFLTAQVFLRANIDHLKALNQVAQSLQKNSEEDQDKAESIDRIAETIRALNESLIEMIERLDK